MRRHLLSGFVLLFILAAAGRSSPALATPEQVLPDGSHQVTLSIPEMECSMCSRSVKDEVKKVSGVSGIRIDSVKRLAIVTFDPGKADVKQIEEAVKKAGFACKPVDGSAQHD